MYELNRVFSDANSAKLFSFYVKAIINFAFLQLSLVICLLFCGDSVNHMAYLMH